MTYRRGHGNKPRARWSPGDERQGQGGDDLRCHSRPISRSPDLRASRTRATSSRSGRRLLVHDVPYVDPQAGGDVRDSGLPARPRGRRDGPARHARRCSFAGETPCDKDGRPLDRSSTRGEHELALEGLKADHLLLEQAAGGLRRLLREDDDLRRASSPDRRRRSTRRRRAQTFGVIETPTGDSVFKYMDTASSRAGHRRADREARGRQGRDRRPRRHRLLRPRPGGEDPGRARSTSSTATSCSTQRLPRSRGAVARASCARPPIKVDYFTRHLLEDAARHRPARLRTSTRPTSTSCARWTSSSSASTTAPHGELIVEHLEERGIAVHRRRHGRPRGATARSAGIVRVTTSTPAEARPRLDCDDSRSATAPRTTTRRTSRSPTSTRSTPPRRDPVEEAPRLLPRPRARAPQLYTIDGNTSINEDQA